MKNLLNKILCFLFKHNLSFDKSMKDFYCLRCGKRFSLIDIFGVPYIPSILTPVLMENNNG